MVKKGHQKSLSAVPTITAATTATNCFTSCFYRHATSAILLLWLLRLLRPYVAGPTTATNTLSYYCLLLLLLRLYTEWAHARGKHCDPCWPPGAPIGQKG